MPDRRDAQYRSYGLLSAHWALQSPQSANAGVACGELVLGPTFHLPKRLVCPTRKQPGGGRRGQGNDEGRAYDEPPVGRPSHGRIDAHQPPPIALLKV